MMINWSCGPRVSSWVRFGYSVEYVQAMRSQDFWDAVYAKIGEIDPLIAETRGGLADF